MTPEPLTDLSFAYSRSAGNPERALKVSGGGTKERWISRNLLQTDANWSGVVP